MRRFEHGGNIYRHRGVLDFSASLNPLGMPAGVRLALREGAGSFEAYPDPSCVELVRAIAQDEGVPPGQVLACAGATDAITRICLATRPRRGLVCPPCYSGYEQALEQAGAQVVRRFPARAGEFGLSPSMMEHLDGMGLVFLANPNNPTGLALERPLLEQALSRAQAQGALVVLDESFIGFTDERSAVDMLGRFKNLVIVKSFTKLYAMAGLRLGYMLSANAALLESCQAAGQMWAVSTPAQVAGLAALREHDFPRQTREFVALRRSELSGSLRALGLQVVPGVANYLLFKGECSLYAPLLRRGILVRPCDNFAGLNGQWHRVAVRTAGENRRLVGALKEVLA